MWILPSDYAHKIVNTTKNEVDLNLWGVYRYQGWSKQGEGLLPTGLTGL